MKKVILINVSKKDFQYSNIKKYEKKFKIIFSEDKKNFEKKILLQF